MLDRSSKVINGGRRALVLHSQRMKMVSYVQPVIREPEDSWHRSAFNSWIHIHFNLIITHLIIMRFSI